MIEVLSQRDDRWKNIKLGFSDKTIGSHGCTITCIAMLAGLNPDEVNERLKNVNGFALKNLVIWRKIDEAIPWLEWKWRGWEYDNVKVKANLPCLVEVDGKRIGAIKHWVLYVGNQTMHDPWYGTSKSTSYYAPTGYSIIKKTGDKPQDTTMSELQEKYDHLKYEYELEQQRLIDEKDKVKKLAGKVKSLENRLQEEDNALRSFLSTLGFNLGTTQNQNEIIAAVRTAKENEANLQKELKAMQVQVALHIKKASEAMDSPLVNLEGVLGALEVCLLREKKTDIEIIEPILKRLWEFIKKQIGKVVK